MIVLLSCFAACASGGRHLGTRGKSPNQFLEGSVPSGVMAADGVFAAQAGMDEREFGSGLNSAQADLHARNLVALVDRPADDPAPAHDDTLGPSDLQERAGTFVPEPVRGPEAHAEAAAYPRVRHGADRGTVVGPPPGANALGGYQRVKHDGRPRRDAADEGDFGHRPVSLAFRSLASA